MPTGLSVPLGVDKLGRAVTESGSNQLQKLLSIALQPCPSDNPFQELGLDERLIFSINAPAFQSRVKLAIERIFAPFQNQGRAKLRTVKFQAKGEEIEVFITYQDMETTEDRDIAVILPRQPNVRPRTAIPER